MRRWLPAIVLAALTMVLPASAVQASDPGLYGFEAVSASLSTHQAGAHPDFALSLELKLDPESPVGPSGNKALYASTRNLSIELPPGLLANPNAVPQCSAVQFQAALTEEGGCPIDSQVGTVKVRLLEFKDPVLEPVYLLKPPGGDAVARLGFIAAILPVYLDAHLRSNDDYGVTVSSEGTSTQAGIISAESSIWGVPADHSHDAGRVTPYEAVQCLNFHICGAGHSSGMAPVPFMTNPTNCGGQLQVGFSSDSYQLPGRYTTATAPLGEISGCEALGFPASLTATPSTRQAASAGGLDVDLKMPQSESVNTLATSQMRDTKVDLPAGIAIAPGAGDGLAGCSASQAGYKSLQPAQCPPASKIGTAEIDSPALPGVLEGAVYQRTPEPGHLFRVWLIADGFGAHIALPVELEVDKGSGQIHSVVLDAPRAPVREVSLHIFGGPRGPIATPASCGVYQTHFELTPWSGNGLVSDETPMTIDQGCGTGGFSPKLDGGSVNPVGGAFSPFVVKLTRESGEQNVAGVEVSLPRGVLAKPAGVALCEGAAAESGNCPPSSRIGAVKVAAGPGPAPLWLPQPGKDPVVAYFSGPYRGAPYSFVIKAPAQAGPFDLGVVVTRVATYVDPETAQITALSDPLPQFLEGVPITYRTIEVNVDRPEFTLNPTSCDPKALGAKVTSDRGVIASATQRYQLGGCERLPFKPALSLRLAGGTKRGAHPALTAVLRPRAGDANTANASVSLPHSEFLDQAHIGTVCTRVQFAANACPAASIYGQARAFTPLLDRPEEGPLYLRSSSHKLPDLVADFHGQIHFVLDGRIDSVNGGIRSTFDSAPDVPVSKVVLTMKGGGKGLLVNSTNLCAKTYRAIARFTGQNGKVHDFRPALRSSCAAKSKPGKRAR